MIISDDDLFAYARNSDPDTAHDAAAQVNVAHLEGVVFATLVALGGEGTWREVSEKSGIDKASVSPRFRRLADKGLIQDSGRRKPGWTNRMQIIWRITNNERTQQDIHR